MHASNPETIYFCRVWGLNPGPADNRFRLSAHCANEPQRQVWWHLSALVESSTRYPLTVLEIESMGAALEYETSNLAV